MFGVPHAPAKWSKFSTQPHQVYPCPDPQIIFLCALIYPKWEWAIAPGNLLDTLLRLAVLSLGAFPCWAGAQVLLLQCPPPGVDPQQNVSSPGRVQHREVRDSHPLIPVLGSVQKLPSGMAQVLSYSILQLQPNASEVAVPEGPAALHTVHTPALDITSKSLSWEW